MPRTPPTTVASRPCSPHSEDLSVASLLPRAQQSLIISLSADLPLNRHPPTSSNADILPLNCQPRWKILNLAQPSPTSMNADLPSFSSVLFKLGRLLLVAATRSGRFSRCLSASRCRSSSSSSCAQQAWPGMHDVHSEHSIQASVAALGNESSSCPLFFLPVFTLPLQQATVKLQPRSSPAVPLRPAHPLLPRGTLHPPVCLSARSQTQTGGGTT